MNVQFDRSNVIVTELGVGLRGKHEAPPEHEETPPARPRDEQGERYVLVPTDAKVKVALQAIVADTLAAMEEADAAALVAGEIPKNPRKYEPAERYGPVAHLTLPLDDPLAARIRTIHDATNLETSAKALDEPDRIVCYFVRMIDGGRRRLTALRQARQFKGALKGRYIHLATDSYTMIDDPLFRLDNVLDLVADSETIHILHPSGFEIVGDLEPAILSAAEANVKAIAEDVGVLDAVPIIEMAAKHARVARTAANIRSLRETKGIDLRALVALCKENGVEVKLRGKNVVVAKGHERGFLEVLDRRRYNVRLVKNVEELFRANSRESVATRPAPRVPAAPATRRSPRSPVPAAPATRRPPRSPVPAAPAKTRPAPTKGASRRRVRRGASPP